MTWLECSNCIMDESAPEIEFYPDGCSFCVPAVKRLERTEQVSPDTLDHLVKTIIQEAEKKQAAYHCVIGVSGGVDSTFLLAKAVSLGLKPLAVHMDNCWNSAEATVNISSVISKLGVDLVTEVMPWREQREAQLAFLAADVVDVELLYDNCLRAVLYKVAKKYGIPFILGGQNDASEGVEVSKHWVWNKLDAVNIRGILAAGGISQTNIPLISLRQWLTYTYVHKISWVDLLNYVSDYSKEAAVEMLRHEFGFRPYKYKHYENVFTRFYQAEILPTKFGIDKRKAHLSSLIVKGEITRETAKKELSFPPYPPSLRLLDREDVIAKLGLSDADMEDYLRRKRIEHRFYRTDFFLLKVWPALLSTRRQVITLAAGLGLPGIIRHANINGKR